MSRLVSDQVYEWNIALGELTQAVHGFARADIVHVEAHWWYYDLLGWSSGYVVGLKDGRRAYIDYGRYLEDDEEFIQVMVNGLGATDPYPSDARMPSGWDQEGVEALTEALHMPPLTNSSQEHPESHP
jgi:hypothetical protein